MQHPLTATFLREVEQALAGSPYTVTPTDEGFDVTLNLEDRAWHHLLRTRHVREAYTWHTRVREDGRFVVTDDTCGISWEAGVPVANSRVRRALGRSWHYAFERTWQRREDGSWEKAREYTCQPHEARDLIVQVGTSLGLANRRNSYEVIAILAATVALGGLVILGGSLLLQRVLG